MFEDFYGQESICDAFSKFIRANKLPHSIFWGPAGCGKTTLARQIAAKMSAQLIELDAANFSIDALRAATSKNEALFKTLIFIDEIHRLNRAQQDSLLKPLETESFVLIGASTMNPIYALSKALNSRTIAFEFAPLSSLQMHKILDAALLEGEEISDEARDFAVTSSVNDARAMLNLIKHARTLGSFSLKTLKRLRPALIASKESQFVIISALIKSMRASDKNAAIYYLARALVSGVAPEYIARRLVIFASEDVGNAQPNALLLANAALLSSAQIGMPEIRIVLAQVVVFLAACKKSNASYKAINAAMSYAQNAQLPDIPEYLDNNSAQIAKYIYPHDNPNAHQPLAPGVPEFYDDFGVGYEANFAHWAQQGLYR